MGVRPVVRAVGAALERAVVVFAGAAGFGFVAGGFDIADKLCLEARGARFTASETEARGRAFVEDFNEAADSAGDTTLGRVAPEVPAAAAIGFELADADREGLEIGGAGDFAGASDARRLGAGAGTAGVRDAIAGLEIAEEALVDFLRTGAAVVAGGLAVAGVEVTAGLAAGALTEPVPNVPELRI